MSRRLGFNFRKACRRIDPELHRRLYPTEPLGRDAQDRLTEIAGEIDGLNWYSDAQLASEQLVRLTDERRRLRDALKHQTARRAPTAKSSESEGKSG